MNNFVDIGLPDKMHVEKKDGSMTIIREWFSWKAIIIIAFAVIWNISVFSDITSLENLPRIPLAISFCISYYALAKCFNKTEIKISKQRLEIKHGPLPWIGNKKLDALNIKQVYGREKVSHNGNYGSSISYEVHTIAHRGKDAKILSGLSTSHQALYIEQEIEKYLGIKNQPVRSELGY